MAKIGELLVKIGADASSFKKGLADSTKQVETFGKKMEVIGGKLKNIGKNMTLGVTMPIIGIAAASFKLASDMSESLNKVDVAFKDNAAEIKEWAKTTLNSFGIAKGTALDMAATYGDMATGMGLTTAEAAKMSMGLVGLAGDLASFKNISIDVANTALTSIFTGETESLKQLGIVMTQANLEEFALARGIKKKISAMTQSEQVQLRYAYVTEMSKNAVGDFARTQDGAANQTRIFSESLKELGAMFGENLLPAITPVITKINELLKAFGQLGASTQQVIVIGSLIAAALGPAAWAIGQVISTGKMIAPAFTKIGSVLKSVFGGLSRVLSSVVGWVARAWPIIAGAFEALAAALGISVGWMVAIIAGLVVAGVLLIKNWDKVKAFGIRIWTGIKSAWAPNMAALKAGILDLGKTLSDMAKSAYKWGADLLGKFWDGVKSKWGELKAGFSSIGANIKAAFTGEVVYDPSSMGISAEHRSHLATGTDFWQGGVSWVGENGPELVNLPRGAQVLSNSKSMAALGGQTINHTGTVIHQFQTNDGAVVKRIAEEFERGNRRIPSRVATMPSMA